MRHETKLAILVAVAVASAALSGGGGQRDARPEVSSVSALVHEVDQEQGNEGRRFLSGGDDRDDLGLAHRHADGVVAGSGPLTPTPYQASNGWAASKQASTLNGDQPGQSQIQISP